MTTAVSLYVARDSGLHHLHPLTKVALATFCLVSGLVWPGLASAYLVFALLVLPLAAWGKIIKSLLPAAWRTVLPFAVSLFLIQGFLWTGGTPLLKVGPLSLKREGLLFATASTGRILLIVSTFLLLTLSTRPDALMIALTQRGVPKNIAYILLTTLQIVPRFQAKAATILDAQQARGLETKGNLWRRLKALLPLVQPLILGSLIDIEERAIALEARAFGRRGLKTNLLIIADSTAQLVIRWLLLAASLALLAIRLLGIL
ncbi:MAG: energy-coupling factor transporter transmembrane protein EcfT [Chloroflexi bacterium]|nr:energy-coupling factor transporter transmembrane protein EcfT [Chloroflexota bacterium]